MTMPAREAFLDLDWLTSQFERLGSNRFTDLMAEGARVHGGAVAAVADALSCRALVAIRDGADLSTALTAWLPAGSWSAAPGGPDRYRRDWPDYLLTRMPVTVQDAHFAKPGHRRPPTDAVSLSSLRLRPPVTHAWLGHMDGIWECAISPDGRRLVSASRDRSLITWDTAGACIARQETEDELRDCVVSRDSRHVLSVSRGGLLTSWELDTLHPIATRRVGGPWRWRRCAVLAGSDLVAVAGRGPTIELLESPTLRDVHTVALDAPAVALSALPDGTSVRALLESSPARIVTVDSRDGRIVDARTVLGWPDMRRPTHPRYAAGFTHDGGFLVAGADEETVLWSMEGAAPVAAAPYGVAGRALRVSHDGPRVASCDAMYQLRVMSLPTLDVIHQWGMSELGCWNLACALAFTPDDRQLIVAGWEGTLRQVTLE